MMSMRCSKMTLRWSFITSSYLSTCLRDVEVARLDLLLRLLQRLVDPGVGDRLAFLQAELLQHAVHAARAEDPHQVVFQRQVELGAAGVALAAGAAAQLVVDAPAFVPLGAEHVEAAGVDRLLLLRDHVCLDLGAPGLDPVEGRDDGGAPGGDVLRARLTARRGLPDLVQACRRSRMNRNSGLVDRAETPRAA